MSSKAERKTEWKAAQRDWLVEELGLLVEKWLSECDSKETVFSPEPEVDQIAKGRTGGCARELVALLKEMR